MISGSALADYVARIAGRMLVAAVLLPIPAFALGWWCVESVDVPLVVTEWK